MSLSPSGRILVKVTGSRGYRGATFADVARASGSFGATGGDSDEQVNQKFAAYIIQQNPGFVGPSGPSNNTRLTLSAFKAASTTDLSSTYDKSLWIWTLGDFSAVPAASLDTLVVKANSTSLATGAWVRVMDSIRPQFFGAKADGTTNDRAAIVLADLVGTIRLTRGLYVVSSNLTIANDVVFDAGARLVIPNDVTVTFGGKVQAGTTQIFNLAGTGTVAGLPTAHAMWFCGDISLPPGGTPTVDCVPLMNKAFLSVGPGLLQDGPWVRLHSGTAYMDMAFASYEGGRVLYLWAGTSRRGIRAEYNTGKGFARGFVFKPLTPGTTATSGEAVYISRPDTDFTDWEVYEPYVGCVETLGSTNFIRSFRIYDAANIGLWTKTIDVFHNDGVIQALYDLVTVTGVTGSFNVGDALTINGGTGNSLITSYAAGRFRAFCLVRPVVGQTITSSSGGSATISAVGVGHQLGGIRLEGAVQAASYSGLEVLGGERSLTIAGGGTFGVPNNAAFCVFEKDVFFDTSYSGSTIDGAYGVDFDCWFSNTRMTNGINVTLVRSGGGTRFGGRIVAARGYGCLVDQTCNGVEFTAKFEGNCGSYTSDPAMAELRLLGRPTNITVTNVRIGFAGFNGTTPPRAITVDADVSDYIKFINVSCPPGSISWGSTGTHNRRVAVDGLADL